MNYTLGACSWSLKTESLTELVRLVTEVGVMSVQLGLDPVVSGDWPVHDVQRVFEAQRIGIASGMIGMQGEDYSSPQTIRETGGVRLTKHWKDNLRATRNSAAVAEQLGISLISFHAGFLPHEASDPERGVLLGRLAQMADIFAERGIRMALETGQETAETLLEVLAELGRENVGVNFDPANMLLYGMGDPIEALEALLPSVFQIHIKDANASGQSGVWGEEVTAGMGQVDWKRFFKVLQGSERKVDLMIEREAGKDRVGDMRAAVKLLTSLGVVDVGKQETSHEQ